MSKLSLKLLKTIKNISYKFIFNTIIFTSVLTCILLIPEITVLLNETIKKLNNNTVKNTITLFTDFYMIINDVIKINKWFIIAPMIFILFLSIIILILKYIFKNKEFIDKVIIGHSSMSKVQFIANTYTDYKVEEINLVNEMEDIKSNYNKIKYAINKQDMFVEEFKHNINTYYDYGYMGIAHTPLIFRLAYQLGDEISIVLFHKYRTGDTKKFKELKSDKDFKNIQIYYENLNVNSNELIFGLSTTFPIKIDELKVLKSENKNIIIFQSEELGFDIINNKNQVESYVQTIMKKIREVVKSKNITKIHIVLSTSVAMTFALGRAISNTHDPEIIVYHFDQKDEKKYTWGIDLFKNFDNCLIIT